MTPTIQHDAAGVPRFVTFPNGAPLQSLAASAPQAQAEEFLRDSGSLLALPASALASLPQPPATWPEAELSGLRFDTHKRVMDSHVIGFQQSYFGLPVVGAGVSVTLRDAPRAVLAAASGVQHDIHVDRPGDEAVKKAMALYTGKAGAVQMADIGLIAPADGLKEPQRDLQINGTRLVVFRYVAERRAGEPHRAPVDEKQGLHEPELPVLPLPPLPDSIRDGSFRVAVEVYLTLTTPPFGRLNWVMYVDVATLGVLQLMPLVDHASAAVFLRDPVTKGSGLLPSATTAQLNTQRDTVSLAGLVPPVAGKQALTGSFVTVVDAVAPIAAVPTAGTPYNFSYNSRTDNFAAASAYYQCDRFFRLVRDLGFDVPSYFQHTALPVKVDHRGFNSSNNGKTINARCGGNATGDGIGTVEFALADLGDTTNPIGIAADWRVVLHELGGHGILWCHVKKPNFGFAHSAGDSFAAILNDPGSNAPDRYMTFPWISAVIPRRHDRTPAAGWGWGGAMDVGSYESEQILSSTLFRLYRSIGGDSASVPRREFAARSVAYLILRAVGHLTEGANPAEAKTFEQELELADTFVWKPTSPAETHAGGAYGKVIRWAFEKQGLFKAPGAASTAVGAPPPVDVYIDDGRHGEYTFQPNHWSCTDIWNRRSVGAGGGVHEEPVAGATNFAYVRIKNRGTKVATGVKVKGFHCQPGIGLTYPDDWTAMTTPQLSAPDIAAGNATGVVVGPFKWTPSQLGHECMFFSVSATDDPSNIDGKITGSIPEWRLVPHDNNIGQRNVTPVAMTLTQADLAKKKFWLRNPFDRKVQMALKAQLPPFLRELGWKFDFVSAGSAGFEMAAGARKEIVFSMSGGQALTRANTPADRAARTIVISGEADGLPIGGMSYEIARDDKAAVQADEPAHGATDAKALLASLKLDQAEIAGVEVRNVTLEISFKSSGG